MFTTGEYRYKDLNCLRCSKPFRSNKSSPRFCSHSCASRFRVGTLSPRWKGGRTKTVAGYIWIRFPEHPKANHGYISEHIVVMEKHLGRPLKTGEHVHHINGIKDDNRLENLVVLTRSQHQHHHHPRIHKPRPCPQCSSLFRPRTATIPKFCSKKCFDLSITRKQLVNCFSCSKPFLKKTSHITKRNFCSITCLRSKRQLRSQTDASNNSTNSVVTSLLAVEVPTQN